MKKLLSILLVVGAVVMMAATPKAEVSAAVVQYETVCGPWQNGGTYFTPSGAICQKFVRKCTQWGYVHDDMGDRDVIVGEYWETMTYCGGY
jgi:hypothetical protein